MGGGSKQANSTVTVFPRIIAPARRRAATRGVGRGYLMSAQRRPRPGGKPLDVKDIFDANGNPVQGPAPPAAGCLAGLFGCGLPGPGLIDQHPGVYGVLMLVNLLQAAIEQIQRRQLAAQLSGGIHNRNR